ncbi:MAG: hypothetical protein KA004_19250 [Verrucomicrobiales bacterium]|nr:hypothetical protein [Verrucomicrobiales bacterium]
MNFAAILAADHADQAAFFSTDASGQQLRAWFPAAPGIKPASFPNAIAAHLGTTTQQDRDLAGLVDRKVRQLTVSVATADLPAAFRNAVSDTIPKMQVIRVGYVAIDAVSYRVIASRTAAGITEMDLELLT